MPRPSHLSPDSVLRFLQVRRDPASLDDISSGFHLSKTDRRPLFRILSKLKKRRAIEELPGGRYRLAARKEEQERSSKSSPKRDTPPAPSLSRPPARDEVTGRLVLHHDGYGFVVPDTPMPQLDGDIFIPRDAVEDAMHGDHVLVKILRRGGTAGAQRAEGRIVRILGR